ncbi:17313_t:CDS:2 [Gigaspora margarita]|uniref:17313_t:CDS:1 n=1 Tax=Gigaspora margarita TaxID=4874 RepID=A0ABM8W4E2_GIGMA|nr:17313_t:CDS:2 [Gigaspora margarita]
MFPKKYENLLNKADTQTSGLNENEIILTKLDVDCKLARFFYSAKEFMDAVHFYIKNNINPFYIGPSQTIWSAIYWILNIKLVKSVLNFILCLPKPIFYNAKYSGSESHTAEYIYNKLKTIIENVVSFKFAGIVMDNEGSM